MGDVTGWSQTETERLQAENAKLREALEKIKSYNPAWPDFYKEYARNIATEALAQEKN